MILYVNGDSHTAAAEAVNPHCFAEDDGALYHLGRQPHPDNLAVSWGRRLAHMLSADFVCDAESASSNARIIRTTRAWIKHHMNQLGQVLMVIQWSTWEREEWLYQDQYWQVNASGIDHVPESLRDQYKNFVSNVDWSLCTEKAHQDIYSFHKELMALNIPHIFFNGNSDFSKVKNPVDWDVCYMSPYDPAMTYTKVLQATGFSTQKPHNWHFGAPAHRFWAEIVLQYIKHNNLVPTHALSTD
jgi:hypothetical protein